MKLHEIPSFNHEIKDLSLREQLAARLLQISGDFHTESQIARMSDYSLLNAFETAMAIIGYGTSEASYNDGFNEGALYATKKASEMVSEVFTMKAGELIASSRDFQ